MFASGKKCQYISLKDLIDKSFFDIQHQNDSTFEKIGTVS